LALSGHRVSNGRVRSSRSITLLCQRLPDLPDESADRLVDTLGDLPLAVDQTANLHARITPISR
jgi:hypothetical protein